MSVAMTELGLGTYVLLLMSMILEHVYHTWVISLHSRANITPLVSPHIKACISQLMLPMLWNWHATTTEGALSNLLSPLLSPHFKLHVLEILRLHSEICVFSLLRPPSTAGVPQH